MSGVTVEDVMSWEPCYERSRAAGDAFDAAWDAACASARHAWDAALDAEREWQIEKVRETLS